MRSVPPPSWMSRTHQQSPEIHQQSHQTDPLLSPSYVSPRYPPSPPSNLKPPSFNRAFNSVFNRKPNRAQSATSLRSAYSAASTHSSQFPDKHQQIHPYSTMAPAPLPVVSAHDSTEDEEECPVCLEPLSFSFRLPGEKPHIVPECGHALHEACFSAVYGPPPGQTRSPLPRKTNLGVCGVCRRPMKVGDGDSGKSNKLAALTGMGDRNSPALYPGRDTPTSPRNGRVPSASRSFDPTEDDPLDHAPSVKSDHSSSAYIVAPSIQVRPEFSSLTRAAELNQPLTCIVVIELPGKRGSAHVPGSIVPDTYSRGHTPAHTHARHDTNHSGSQPRSGQASPHPPRHPEDYDESAPSETLEEEYDEDSPFAAITEDLRSRIVDWKGHALAGLGPLQMYDLLAVRRDSLVREFFVYLFREAIICVVEEKRKIFGRLLDGAPGSGSLTSGYGGSSRGVLRLKGRIYVRHIKQVTASSAAGEMSLTIDMGDERLDSFILIFKDRASLETWRNHIQGLVVSFQNAHPSQRSREDKFVRELDMEEFGGNAKAARMLSGSTGTTVSTTDSLLNGSSRSTTSSSTSHGSSAARQMAHQHKLSPLGEEEPATYDSPSGLVAPHLSSGPSNSLTPLPHPPLDLILVVSLPPPTAVPSTAALKVRVIRATLDFIIASLGPRDRLSLVTFEVGASGTVRKTPFLCLGRAGSRARLAKFVDTTGGRESEGAEDIEDEFLVRGSKEEKTDVVTAVNHGLDVVLQRKARNPVSGMVLVSDSSDSTRRAQMDLVLARAEAANVPIHSFGYGRAHDPASLWLMSNHTGGTYTFVKDWYSLRDCVAGCVGGMMSIGLLSMKLHMKIVDGQRFRIRKVSGGPSSILSSDGHNVDVDVGELRYGERKEMLIELELDNSEATHAASGVRGQNRAMNATDQFVKSMGLDSLSIGDTADLMDGMMDRMIDEMPVFEVDGAFFDPAANKHVSRLAHPVLLTITLLPASSPGTPPNNIPSDPVIVRRRMELLASDMITRALVLVSRKNFPAAQKILSETKRILHTVLQSISRALPSSSMGGAGGSGRNRKEILTLAAIRAMQAILQDLQILSESLEENVDLFAHDQRNFGAQQAMILRDQKSWSGRSATERLFWTTDNSIELVSRSTDWVARE